MKRTLSAAALGGMLMLPALASAAAAYPYYWTGGYIGFDAGVNRSDRDHFSTENALALGLNGGYDYQVSPHFVAGGGLFYEINSKRDHAFRPCPPCGGSNYGSNVYGVDGMLGFPVGMTGGFMPYVKLGYAHMEGTGDASGSDSTWRIGGGLAWRASLPVSISVQYMHAQYGSNSGHWKNDNLTLGVTYHFRP